MRNITGILTSQTIKRLQHVKSGTCLLIDPECSILEIKEITKPRDLSASDVELLCKPIHGIDVKNAVSPETQQSSVWTHLLEMSMF